VHDASCTTESRGHLGRLPGTHMLMIESEGITEQVREWRTDVVARIVAELGLEQVMFEAADPASSPGTSRTTGSTSTSSSTTAESSSSSACAPASGARTTPGRMLAYRG
jgi:hypothetical protein